MLDRLIEEGRLIRHAWNREEGGRQLLCLYTGMMDDASARPGTCPADRCSHERIREGSLRHGAIMTAAHRRHLRRAKGRSPTQIQVDRLRWLRKPVLDRAIDRLMAIQRRFHVRRFLTQAQPLIQTSLDSPEI